jgi:hypothetical protein
MTYGQGTCPAACACSQVKTLMIFADNIGPRPRKFQVWLILAVFVRLPTATLTAGKKACRPIKPGRRVGAYLRSSEPTRRGKFEFFEKFNPKTYERKDYIEGPGLKKPVLYYIHNRGISPSIGRRGRLVLINDYFATEGCKVMVSDLKTHKWWNISSRAVQAYNRNANPYPGLVIVPEGYGFSPSDRRVLIGMDLIYTDVPTAEHASRAGRTFKRYWYVVTSSSGRILHEYRTSKPPACWWVY